MICDTLYLGGMLISMWIWSGHASASIISTPFCSHSFRRICPTSFLICPYIASRLYLGANTICYWHLHVVCCKLPISFSFIEKTSWCLLLQLADRNVHSTRRFFHYLILFTLPSIAGGCRCAEATTIKFGRWGSFSSTPKFFAVHKFLRLVNSTFLIRLFFHSSEQLNSCELTLHPSCASFVHTTHCLLDYPWEFARQFVPYQWSAVQSPSLLA